MVIKNSNDSVSDLGDDFFIENDIALNLTDPDQDLSEEDPSLTRLNQEQD
jgi:hypothetical protein